MYISAGHHSPLFYRIRVTPELEEHLIFFLENGKITTENGANSTETNQKEVVKRPIAQENCNTVHFTCFEGLRWCTYSECCVATTIVEETLCSAPALKKEAFAERAATFPELAT